MNQDNNTPPNKSGNLVDFQNTNTPKTYPNPLTPSINESIQEEENKELINDSIIHEEIQNKEESNDSIESIESDKEEIKKEIVSDQEEKTKDNTETDKLFSYGTNDVLQHLFDEERWLAPHPKDTTLPDDEDDITFFPITIATNKETISLLETIHEDYTNRNEDEKLSEIYASTKYQYSWWGLTAKATQIHQTSTQNEQYANIKTSEKEGIEFKPINEFPDISDKRPSSINVKDKFTTVEAIISTQTQTKGIKHINLLHSGFSIDIIRPGMNKINAIYRYITNMKFELGKHLGMIYYLYGDILIRKYILEHLYSSITGSSFDGYRKYNSFLKALNILDYDTILWSIISLLYPEGYTFSVLCSHKDCAHVEHINLDLNNLKLINYSKLKEINTSFSRQKNLVEVQDYQNTLFNQTIYTDEHPEWLFELRAPSAFDFFESGERFINLTTKEFSNPKADDLNDIIVSSYYRILAPWIKTFTQKFPDGTTRSINNETSRDEDSTSTVETNIERLMPSFQTDNNTLHWKIQDYIRRQQMIYYGVYYNECPKCHRPNENSKNGFIPIDVQNTFFFLAGVRLAQNAKNLSPKKDTETLMIS